MYRLQHDRRPRTRMQHRAPSPSHSGPLHGLGAEPHLERIIYRLSCGTQPQQLVDCPHIHCVAATRRTSSPVTAAAPAASAVLCCAVLWHGAQQAGHGSTPRLVAALGPVHQLWVNRCARCNRAQVGHM